MKYLKIFYTKRDALRHKSKTERSHTKIKSLNEMSKLPHDPALFSSIKEVIQSEKEKAFRNSNSILLQMYWEIGRLIVEDEQKGKSKAVYGKSVLKTLSSQLTLEFGKGFDESNLRNIRQFFLAFPNVTHCVTN